MLLVSTSVSTVLQAMIDDPMLFAGEDGMVPALAMVLYSNNPALSPSTTLDDLDIITDSLLTNPIIHAADTTQLVVSRPDGGKGIRVNEPSLGFTFQTDAGATFPFTAYGAAFVLTIDNEPSTLIAVGAFVEPWVFTGHPQVVQVSSIVGFFSPQTFDQGIAQVVPMEFTVL